MLTANEYADKLRSNVAELRLSDRERFAIAALLENQARVVEAAERLLVVGGTKSANAVGDALAAVIVERDDVRIATHKDANDAFIVFCANHAQEIADLLEDSAERERELRETLREIWESVPATFEPGHPTVERHAKALNAAGALIARDTETEKR